MRISPEDGQISDLPGQDGGGVVKTLPPSDARDPKVLIEQALKGTMIIDRPLQPFEPQRFQAHHIVVVLDFASGKRNREIENTRGLNETTVSHIKHHPYTQKILAAILSRTADNLTDPMERLKAYAGEAIDTKIALLRDETTQKSLKNTIASDILDRAGFGARQKVSVELPLGERPSIPNEESALHRLATALEASTSVRDANFERFVTKAAPQEDEDAGKVFSDQDFGSSDSDSGASHANPPQPLVLEEKKLVGEALEQHQAHKAEQNLPDDLRLARAS